MIEHEIWPDTPVFKEDEAVKEVVDIVDRYGLHDNLRNELNDSVHVYDDSLGYSELRRNGDSEEMALVVESPHANGMSLHRLIGSEVLRLSARQAGITDAKGDYLPVITVASPRYGAHPPRIPNARPGETLNMLSEHTLDRITRMGYGRIALLGFSGGADKAANNAALARHYQAGVDVAALGIGDPAGAEKRTRIGLMKDFTREATKFGDAMDRTDFEVYREAMHEDDMIAFGRSVMMSMNIRDLTRDLGEGLLPRNLIMAAGLPEVRENMVIGCGSESNITDGEKLHAALQENIGSISVAEAAEVTLIEQEKQNHAWGDDMRRVNTFYLRALQHLRQ